MPYLPFAMMMQFNMDFHKVLVFASSSHTIEQAKAWAQQFGLPLSPTRPSIETCEFYIEITPLATRLMNTQSPKQILHIDFNAPPYTTRHGRSEKKSPFLRAMGKRFPNCFIIDAMAGLGRDAVSLAKYGAQVLMIEQHPALALLLTQALAQCKLTHLNLVFDDCETYFAQYAQAKRPDVIYLDPMYPAKSKSALPQKEMQCLQQLTMPQEDSLNLLTLAKQLALDRVVVKRPKWAADYAGQTPDIRYESTNTRWDVYSTFICKD